MFIKFSFLIFLTCSIYFAVSKDGNICNNVCVSINSCTLIHNDLCIDQVTQYDYSKCQLVCEKSLQIDPKLLIKSKPDDLLSTKIDNNDNDRLISLTNIMKPMAIFEGILLNDDTIKKDYNTKDKYTNGHLLEDLANILSKENSIDRNNEESLNRLKDYIVLNKLSDVEIEQSRHANDKINVDLMNYMKLLGNSQGFSSKIENLANKPYFKQVTIKNTNMENSFINRLGRRVKRSSLFGGAGAGANAGGVLGTAGAARGYTRIGGMVASQSGGSMDSNVNGGFNLGFGPGGLNGNLFGGSNHTIKSHVNNIGTAASESGGSGSLTGYGMGAANGNLYGVGGNQAPIGNAGIAAAGNAGVAPAGNAGTVSAGNVGGPFGNAGVALANNAGTVPAGNAGVAPVGNAGTVPSGNVGGPFGNAGGPFGNLGNFALPLLSQIGQLGKLFSNNRM